MNTFLSTTILLLVLFCTAAIPAQAETPKDGVPRHTKVTLIPEFNAITPGQPLTLSIHEELETGWHVYWKNPGDSGESTNVEWIVPNGFTVSEIEFPTPETMAFGPLMNFGYGGKVDLLVTLTPPSTITESDIPIKANISWLVCSDICVPESTSVELVLPVTTDTVIATPTDPSLFSEARAAMPTHAAWQGLVEEQDKKLNLSFIVDDESITALQDAKDLYFFPDEWGVILYATPQTISIADNKLSIIVDRDTRPLSDLTSINGVLGYTDSDGSRKSFEISVPLMGAAAAITDPLAAPPSPTDKTDTASSQPTPPPSSQNESSSVSFAQAIILAVLGGLILNLMPCVFPVLSLKALSLVKMSAKEQKHAALHGLFYTIGILVCFLSIASILVVLQAAGEEIGWGFQFQNPAVVLSLAYLLFIMGMNLSGFFEFKNHFLSNLGHKLASKHGYTGSFFTGMLATAVATPCIGPFMGVAIGFALTQPPAITVLIFLALGLGLALPYLLLCIIPPLRGILPKPGAWMETFRQFMAFPLYASVAWLVWVYAQQVSGDYGVLLSLAGLICIGFAVWAAHHIPHRQPAKTVVHIISISAVILSLIIVVLSASSEIMSEKESTSTIETRDTTIFSQMALDQALEGDHPVFIDMTAAWCITCKVNERVALNIESTQALFQEKGVQVLIGDWTNENPEITKFLKSYGRSGVPLYVYYGPRDKTSGKRPDAVVLPQLLTPGLVAEVLNAH